MINKFEKKWKILILLAFFILMLFVNINNINVAASAIIVLAFSLLLYNHNRRDLLTVIALVFVFAIDFLIGYWNYTLVIAIYFVFHILCAARLYLNLNKKGIIIELVSRAVLIVVAEIVAVIIFKSDFSLLYFFAIFYFANLIMNVVTAGLQIRINAIMFLGMLIFLLSDIFIGLNQLGIWYRENFIEITYILAIAFVSLSLILKPAKGEAVSVLKAS